MKVTALNHFANDTVGIQGIIFDAAIKIRNARRTRSASRKYTMQMVCLSMPGTDPLYREGAIETFNIMFDTRYNGYDNLCAMMEFLDEAAEARSRKFRAKDKTPITVEEFQAIANRISRAIPGFLPKVQPVGCTPLVAWDMSTTFT